MLLLAAEHNFSNTGDPLSPGALSRVRDEEHGWPMSIA
jgi:hypothetical protein